MPGIIELPVVTSVESQLGVQIPAGVALQLQARVFTFGTLHLRVAWNGAQKQTRDLPIASEETWVNSY